MTNVIEKKKGKLKNAINSVTVTLNILVFSSLSHSRAIQVLGICALKFRLSEKDTKFEKIFHLEFDAMSNVKF